MKLIFSVLLSLWIYKFAFESILLAHFKKVFPELHEWCEERKFTLIDCDLRWGVPKDSTTRTTICTCMEELDRCYEDNNDLPFFINILSERSVIFPFLSGKNVIMWFKFVSRFSMAIRPLKNTFAHSNIVALKILIALMVWCGDAVRCLKVS